MKIKDQFRVVATETHITVYWVGKSIMERGEISADLMPGHWWIARALVQPEKLRGKGIGTRMMKKFQKEVKKSSCKKAVVSPGGYDFSRKKIDFYRKNGFKGKKGLLKWET